MKEVEFGTLIRAVEVGTTVHEHSRLSISEAPDPFIAPKLYLHDDSVGEFNAEVILIQASAAVGKSTVAKYLSATKNVPLLNLAEVPVSTGTLAALISDMSSTPDLLTSFHEGKSPIVIDALDEGRLLSGERGFDSFLETARELLLNNRSVTDRPKILVFGRNDSTDWAQFVLEFEGDINVCMVEIGFFEEEEAYQLIDAYAKSSLGGQDRAPYLDHVEPAKKVIQAYFSAIEAALDLSQGELWLNERGRAFAGYAPVLAAVGSLLGEIENFSAVERRLKDAGTQEAWSVIEIVLDEILNREQNKLRDQLVSRGLEGPIPPEAYDREEQLTYLSNFVHGSSIGASRRLAFTGGDDATYYEMVEQYLPEHPFIRRGKLGNPVLGSKVLAHAVMHDLLRLNDLTKLTDASTQPFLWRSIRSSLENVQLIDGRYLGCVLSSFWTDPLSTEPRTLIRTSTDPESVSVTVPSYCDNRVFFQATTPIVLVGLARECDIDVEDMVEFVGYGKPSSMFNFYGTSSTVCRSAVFSTDSIVLEGNIWFEAQEVTNRERMELHVKKSSKIGFDGQFLDLYPWNRIRPTLQAPYAVDHDNPLFSILDECCVRLPFGQVLTLNADFTVPEDDRYMSWVKRISEPTFVRLIRVLVESGLANGENAQTSGPPKARVHFSVGWEDLRFAIHNPDSVNREDLREAIQQLV